jgi:hypothetical protein
MIISKWPEGNLAEEGSGPNWLCGKEPFGQVHKGGKSLLALGGQNWTQGRIGQARMETWGETLSK